MKQKNSNDVVLVVRDEKSRDREEPVCAKFVHSVLILDISKAFYTIS